jgi:phospholipid N-methyltransferase
MRLLTWIKEAIKSPRELSTIFPSSKHLAWRIAQQVDAGSDNRIAELGAGDGALTGPLVEQLNEGSKLYLLEQSRSFCEKLREDYLDHPKRDQIHILQEDASRLDELVEREGLGALDYVISGLPLSTLPDEVSDKILRVTYDVLEPGGKYIQFQYSLDYLEDIEEIFDKVETLSVWRNLYFKPTWIYVAEKKSE